MSSLKPPRDPRLDFFRGIAMMIIFIAHMPRNFWALWIPSRFGFSDATEIFVFCSGIASAIAFGQTFQKQGFWIGTARVGLRVWQIYWAHIALFMTITVAMIALNRLLDTDYYLRQLNLLIFFENTPINLLGLMTLTYVPNYFDILPMYLVILMLIPIVMGLSKWRVEAVFVLMISLWIMANLRWLNLPAEPWSNRPWFFNPFAWQLIFFTGFALKMGWLPTPPVRRSGLILAALIILITIPFAWFRLLQAEPFLREINMILRPYASKTHFGILQLVHFLALAYLAYGLVGANGHRLRGFFVQVICKVGQQTLPVFLFGMLLSQLGGALLHNIPRTTLNVSLVNLTGILLLIGVAYFCAWFKSTPWRKETVDSPRSVPVGG